jgi:hypothetical protein
LKENILEVVLDRKCPTFFVWLGFNCEEGKKEGRMEGGGGGRGGSIKVETSNG